jgi:hypothetical protein
VASPRSLFQRRLPPGYFLYLQNMSMGTIWWIWHNISFAALKIEAQFCLKRNAISFYTVMDIIAQAS